jgi:hypothetical protein
MSDEWDEGHRNELPKRAKLIIKENDLLFSKPYRSLPKVVIIPKELEEQLASSGFYGIRTNNYKEACLLWSLFRSELIQKQFIHLCSGYTQRELNDDYLNTYLVIPIPINHADISNIVAQNINKAKKAREAELEAISAILKEPEISIYGN